MPDVEEHAGFVLGEIEQLEAPLRQLALDLHHARATDGGMGKRGARAPTREMDTGKPLKKRAYLELYLRASSKP